MILPAFLLNGGSDLQKWRPIPVTVFLRQEYFIYVATFAFPNEMGTWRSAGEGAHQRRGRSGCISAYGWCTVNRLLLIVFYGETTFVLWRKNIFITRKVSSIREELDAESACNKKLGTTNDVMHQVSCVCVDGALTHGV